MRSHEPTICSRMPRIVSATPPPAWPPFAAPPPHCAKESETHGSELELELSWLGEAELTVGSLRLWPSGRLAVRRVIGAARGHAQPPRSCGCGGGGAYPRTRPRCPLPRAAYPRALVSLGRAAGVGVGHD
eukprot:1087295-Prymnesium_polylepis.1